MFDNKFDRHTPEVCPLVGKIVDDYKILQLFCISQERCTITLTKNNKLFNAKRPSLLCSISELSVVPIDNTDSISLTV